jgi:hypothetical protein
MKVVNALVGLSITLLSFSSWAQEETQSTELVKAALLQISANLDKAQNLWRYHQTTSAEDMLRVESFDARLNEGSQWQLMSENGQEPDAVRLAEYAQDKADTKPKEGQKTLSFSELVKLESLRFVSEDETQLIYKFVPQIDELDNDGLNGELRLNKQSKQLDVIKIINSKDLSPAFSVSLTQFELTMNFAAVTGLVMPAKITTKVKGSVAFFKSIDSEEVVSYSDYEVLTLSIPPEA